MSGWNDGYVTDLVYTQGFYREMTPAQLALAVTIRGIRPPAALSGSYRYCELGCGRGVGTAVLAAGNPNGEFWGVDFNPTQIAGAQRLAQTAALGNLHFLEKSFEEFLDTETPTFDVIALHGVYSWVIRRHQQAIVAILRQKLNPGGLVYISYNALPGWSALMPLRFLLAKNPETAHLPSVPRIDKNLALAATLLGTKAQFFAGNPNATRLLEQIQNQSRNYVAHEYLGSDFLPMFHADVAQDLEEAKLAFAGSANLSDFFDTLNLTPEALTVLNGITDASFRETVRDYYLNQRFRRDVYVRGADRLTNAEQRKLLGATRFALVVTAEEALAKAKFANGEVTLGEEVYQPLVKALEEGIKSGDELVAWPGLAALGQNQVLHNLVMLCATGRVCPLPAVADGKIRPGHGERYNLAVIDTNLEGEGIGWLASPVTGSGHIASRIEMLFLAGLAHGLKDPAAFAWERVKKSGRKLVKNGTALESDQDNLEEMRSIWTHFAEKRIPILRRLGVVKIKQK
ncbi:Methyltransferase [uncultured Gammaproteobacteria bacterium]